MKKVLLIIGILLIVASVPVAVFLVQQRKELRLKAAPESELYFDPATASGEVGGRLTLAVMINPHANVVVGVDTYITFDPNIFQYVESSATGALAMPNDPVYSNDQGYVFFNFIDLNKEITQTSSLVSITFEVIGGEGTSQVIQFTPISTDGAHSTGVVARGERGQNVLAETRNATITVLGAALTPTPTTGGDTPSATPTNTPAATATPTAPEATSTPTAPAGATATPTSTAPTATRTPTPTSVPGATNTPTPTATPTTSGTTQATSTPTNTPTPTTAGFNVATPTPTIPVAGINLPTVFSLGMGLVLMAIGILVFL